jgi:restriction system protein
MIFDFKDYCDPLLLNNNPYPPYASDKKCIYCHTKLTVVEISDFWDIDDRQILDVHKVTIQEYKEIHDLEDHYLNLDLDTRSSEIWLDVCPACGWWNLIKNISIFAEVWQLWDFYYGCSGVLKELDIEDDKTRIDEVARYLIAKYESRSWINPKIFEEVVADVFKIVAIILRLLDIVMMVELTLYSEIHQKKLLEYKLKGIKIKLRLNRLEHSQERLC